MCECLLVAMTGRNSQPWKEKAERKTFRICFTVNCFPFDCLFSGRGMRQGWEGGGGFYWVRTRGLSRRQGYALVQRIQTDYRFSYSRENIRSYIRSRYVCVSVLNRL